MAKASKKQIAQSGCLWLIIVLVLVMWFGGGGEETREEYHAHRLQYSPILKFVYLIGYGAQSKTGEDAQVTLIINPRTISLHACFFRKKDSYYGTPLHPDLTKCQINKVSNAQITFSINAFSRIDGPDSLSGVIFLDKHPPYKTLKNLRQKNRHIDKKLLSLLSLLATE